MKLLNLDESLELFSHHAFRSKIPIESFKELTALAVEYCEGNPLALEVLGSNLSKQNAIRLWESELKLLGKEIDNRIQSVLIRGYESLPYESDKHMFLHIACFFIGNDVDYVVKILERDYSASSRITILSDRYLLSVSPNKKVMMHRLLIEMARNIVRKESPNLGRRSRLWHDGDSYDVLWKGKGSESVEGLALDMQMLRGNMYFQPSYFRTNSLIKMDNLKFLKLNHVHITGSYKDCLRNLRWLCWIEFHLRTIPSGLFMGDLVAIDMSYSKLDVFEVPVELHCLQILNLKDSRNLSEIRNLSRLPKLESLILWNCHQLVCVCETIGDLGSLALLNMTGCGKLFQTPGNSSWMQFIGRAVKFSGEGSTRQTSFSLPRSLQRLFLKDCDLKSTDNFPMLYEFGIMSTSLPDIKDPNMTPVYTAVSPSKSPYLSFEVPECPKNRRIKGLDVTLKYTVSGEDATWFVKIRSTGVVDLMYNPHVFGKPGSDDAAIWFSYWPIGNTLNVGDIVDVSIVVKSGLHVLELGASLVYTDIGEETLTLGGDLSRFQLSTGAHYLCRRDFFELMEVGSPTPGWFKLLVGDATDHREVRGWRKTGRPQQLSCSFTELKTVGCIVHGPESEDIYKIAEMSKPSFANKMMDLIQSTLGGTMKSATTPELSHAATKAVVDETVEFTSSSLKEKIESSSLEFSKLSTKDVLEEAPVASSSSNKAASPLKESRSFDVYLSTDSLHGYDIGYKMKEEIIRAGLRVAESGDEGNPEEMISTTRASVFLLEWDYAWNSECLNELLLIMEQRRRNSNYFVLPVFYGDVEPQDVREHRDYFALDHYQTSDEWKGKVDEWKAALTEVATLPAIRLSYEDLGPSQKRSVIKEIARRVRDALNPTERPNL